MVWECLKTWSTDCLIVWNDLRMPEGLINQLSNSLKWPENILWPEVLKIWQSGFLPCWSSDSLMIWDYLKWSENVWKFLKISDIVWRYICLTDWLSGGLRITDNLIFWPSDVLICLIISEKFWYQLFSDIQIIRESGHQRVSHSQTIRFLLLIPDFFRRTVFFRPSENLSRCWCMLIMSTHVQSVVSDPWRPENKSEHVRTPKTARINQTYLAEAPNHTQRNHRESETTWTHHVHAHTCRVVKLMQEQLQELQESSKHPQKSWNH